MCILRELGNKSKMFDDTGRFHRETLSKIIILLRVLFDFIVFFVWSIPLWFHALFKLIFKRKKCIKGKNVLVTGGGNGLGKAICLSLAAHGCNVIVSDINLEAAEKTAIEVTKMRVKSKAYKTDVTSPKDALNLRQEAIKDFGQVDILVNNAGIVSSSNFGSEAHLEMIVKVNLFGPLLMTKIFLEHMKETKSGHIVSISSMAGLQPSPFIIAYTGTKYGVCGFMAALNEHLRLEKLSDHIKTTCIFPYYISTKIISDFLNTNIRLPPLNIDYAANEVVQAIRREDHVTTIPRSLELIRILQCLPLNIQQFFNDRISRQFEMKDPNFKQEEI